MELGFQVWGLSSITMFFYNKFHFMVIHDLVVHLVSDGEVLDNRGPDNPK